MYVCFRCCARFDAPDIIRRRENLDGENGWWDYDQAICPACGDEEIEEGENEDDEAGEAAFHHRHKPG